MSRALRVAVVNGSPSATSKTAALAALVTDTLAGILPVEVEKIDVYSLGSAFTQATTREDLPPEVEERYRAVEDADLLIAATPVFRASYTGMFKHFFDLTGQYALANTPVLLLATGGSDRHAMVIDHQMRPLFAFFQALTLPVGIYANTGEFDGNIILNPEVYSRVQIALNDVADLLQVRLDTPSSPQSHERLSHRF